MKAWVFILQSQQQFKEPLLKIDSVDYYAVDHTPSYLWDSATRSISAALIVHLPDMIEGREGWKKNRTIENAINIDRGEIQKESILSFQNRGSVYPYHFKDLIFKTKVQNRITKKVATLNGNLFCGPTRTGNQL